MLNEQKFELGWQFVASIWKSAASGPARTGSAVGFGKLVPVPERLKNCEGLVTPGCCAPKVTVVGRKEAEAGETEVPVMVMV